MPFGVRLVCHVVIVTQKRLGQLTSPMPFGVRLVCHRLFERCGAFREGNVTNAFRREAGLSLLR